MLRHEGVLVILDKNVAALDARRPWLPSILMKRIDEYRGRWMYPARGPVRERWFWPSGFSGRTASQVQRRPDRSTPPPGRGKDLALPPDSGSTADDTLDGSGSGR